MRAQEGEVHCARMTLLCRNSPFSSSIHLQHTLDLNFNLTSPPHNGPVIRQIIGVTNNRNSQNRLGPITQKRVARSDPVDLQGAKS